MACNSCGQSYMQYSTSVPDTNNNIIQSCKYTIHDLQKIIQYLVDNPGNNAYINSVVQSQINTYNTNCNKFVVTIEQLLNEQLIQTIIND